MKFKEYLQLIADDRGFVPTTRIRWVIRKNPRKTAREEAIAAKVIEMANPRENISGHYPWGPEEELILQQFWFHPENELAEWRDVFIEGGNDLFSVEETKFGKLPIPNAIKEPGMIRGNFSDQIKKALGEDNE
jgi:hypothetical protein